MQLVEFVLGHRQADGLPELQFRFFRSVLGMIRGHGLLPSLPRLDAVLDQLVMVAPTLNLHLNEVLFTPNIFGPVSDKGIVQFVDFSQFILIERFVS